MAVFNQGVFSAVFFVGLFDWSHSSNDPYRWILSRGKPTSQSSTVGNHVASYATDGDYNNYDLPLSYSQTTVSTNPYIQVDLGVKGPIDFVVLNFPMDTDPPQTFQSIRIIVGETASVSDPSSVMCFGTYNLWKYNLIQCNKRGRYITVQSFKSSVELKMVEMAVHRRPIESLSYKKPAASCSVYGADYIPAKTVDMNPRSFFVTNYKKDPWVRIDLGDVHFVHEVSLWSRHDCCERPHSNLHIRAGNSLDNDGNSNHLCGKADLYTLEIRSIYCDVLARYVNVRREVEAGFLELGEIVVNPETTDNLAVHAIGKSANVGAYKQNLWVGHLMDGILGSCHVMKAEYIAKEVWIKMQDVAQVSRILIYNNPEKLDELTDFDIKVGMSLSEKSLCLPGLKSMTSMLSASFFCEPRVTATIDHRKHRYVWSEESQDLTLNCGAKGYPSPVVTWIKDSEVLKSGSDTLEVSAASRNHSGVYECWANNTHGVDYKMVDVEISSDLRICAEVEELQYVVANPNNNDVQLKGTRWYSFYDPEQRKHLQLYDSTPKRSSSCQAWLPSNHPEITEGVVSRALCVKNEIHDCSATIDVYIRRCASSYIYNFKHLMSTPRLTFCLVNAPHTEPSGHRPATVSPVKDHALSQKVFHTEPDVSESHQCLTMCQLDARCKSFNYSKKVKICELNSATKREFPGNYAFHADYNYYHMSDGVAMSVKEEL